MGTIYKKKVGRTSFLIVLLKIIIESIVRAVWAVVKAVTQSIRLEQVKMGRGAKGGESTPLGQRQDRGANQ